MTTLNDTGAISTDAPFRAVSSETIFKEERGLALVSDIELPANLAPSALGQGGFGAIDEHSGSYSYRIPVHVPTPQHGGPSPRVALVYNSQTGRSESLVAHGWRLELGRVVRGSDTDVEFRNNQGSKEAADYFELYFNGSKRTLVVQKNDDGQANNSFRVKIESSFLEVKYHLSDTVLDPDSKEPVIDYWEVFTANGTRYLYGHKDSDSPSEKVGGELPNKVWNLTQISDVHGRRVLYEYQAYSNSLAGELAYSYPTLIKSGVTADGQWWDCEIRLVYSDTDLPDKINGYHKLDSKYTGRRRSSCVIWQCVSQIETWFRDHDGTFSKCRVLQIDALQKNKTIRWVEQVQEIAFKGGKEDSSIEPLLHKFTYRSTRINPALLTTAHTPMGKQELMTYGRATKITKGKKEGFNTDMYLLVTYTEQALVEGEQESWAKRYEYHDGYFFLPFREYRGHGKVVVIDEETGQRIESEFEQNGVHNGYLAKKTVYDASEKGRIVSTTENKWMALDYSGGRFLPFRLESVEAEYAEDGKTVVSTEITQIAEDTSQPWGYALDRHGNVLKTIQLTFAGPANDAPALRKQVTETKYRPYTGEQPHRLIGLSEEVQVSVSDSANKAILKQLQQRRYNQRGQVIETREFVDREGGYLKTSAEYDSDHGQLLCRYRYEGQRKILVTENQYYPHDVAERYLLKSETNALGHRRKISRYDLQSRERVSSLEEDGVAERVDYDGLNRAVRERRIANVQDGEKESTETVTYQYTLNAQQRSILTSYKNTGHTRRDEFDALGRKTCSIDSGYLAREVIREQTKYDHRTRQPARVDVPHYKDDTSPAARITQYSDARLRKSKEISASGKCLEYSYNGLLTTITELVYSPGSSVAAGNKPPRRRITQQQSDVFGRLTAQSEGGEGHAGDYQIQIDYDALDRPILVTDSLGAELQATDYGQRLDEQAVSQERKVSAGFSRYRYDALGRLIETHHGKKPEQAQIISLVYDDLDRVLQEHSVNMENGLTRELVNRYDEQPYAIGQLSAQQVREKSQNAGSTEQRKKIEYDAFGLPASEYSEWLVDWPDLELKQRIQFQTQTRHNGEKSGRLERVEHSGVNGVPGGTIEYRYDDVSGLPIAVLFDDNPVWQIGEAGYTARKQQQAITLGSRSTTRYEFEAASGLLADIHVNSNNKPILQQQLCYDSSGQVTTRAMQSAQASDAESIASSDEYSYDAKHQITEVHSDKQNQTFSYHPDGRRATSNEANSEKVISDYSSHQLIRLSGGANREFSYDAQGRMVLDINQDSGFTRHLTWLPGNRLHQLAFTDAQQKSARRLRYAYDSDNQRALKYDTEDNSLVVYADRELQITLAADGSTHLRTNILLPDSSPDAITAPEPPAANMASSQSTKQNPAAPGALGRDTIAAQSLRRIAAVERDSSGGNSRLYYYHRDHQYSINAVTDQQGQLVSSINYTPFGKVANISGPYTPDVLYTGQRADLVEYGGFSLYDYKTRLYDPELGMFLSPDTEDDSNNSAFGYNRYAYVGNSPINRMDPTGEWAFLIGYAAMAAVSVLTGYVLKKAITLGKGDYTWADFGIDATAGVVTRGLSHARHLHHFRGLNEVNRLRNAAQIRRVRQVENAATSQISTSAAISTQAVLEQGGRAIANSVAPAFTTTAKELTVAGVVAGTASTVIKQASGLGSTEEAPEKAAEDEDE